MFIKNLLKVLKTRLFSRMKNCCPNDDEIERTKKISEI